MSKRVIAAFCAIVCAEAGAADMTTHFVNGGQHRTLIVDMDHVAVSKGNGAASATVKLSDAEAAAFDQLGVAITPRSTVKANDKIIGYPVWFNKQAGAVAILTHEIVVRLDSSKHTRLVKAITGFKDLAPTGFRHDLYVAKFASPMGALEAANELSQKKGVRYAHPNFIVPKQWRGPKARADEPLFSKQWHLANAGQLGGTPGADIGVRNAWDVTLGTDDVLVAVLDAGFELTHPDLEPIWFSNSGEVPRNGVDDDGNGYIDDVRGWNFDANTNDVSTGLFPQHGTSVAGLVAARQNGRGVSGVCPACTVLPLALPFKPVADAAAFYYAEKMGADVITNSWGYAKETPNFDVVAEAINEVATRSRDGRGTLILFAMNNIDQNDCVGSNPDISSLEMVVAVSSASDQDKRVSYAAWGECMEFLSPSFESGRAGITTTDLTGAAGYNNGRFPGDLTDLDYTNDFGGTSAATPIAAGVFGLMLSVNPELTRDEALAMVIATADKVSPVEANYNSRTGFSLKYGYGRIHAGKAVRAAEVFHKYTRRAAAEKERQAAADAVKKKKKAKVR
jgi:subtilisin family serine protease